MRQEVGAEGWKNSEPKSALKKVPAAFGQLLDVLHLLQHPARSGHGVFADRRQKNPPPAALDKLHAEPRFQFLKLCTESGLANMASLRRPAKVEGIGQCDEVAQLAQRGHDRQSPRLSPRRLPQIKRHGFADPFRHGEVEAQQPCGEPENEEKDRRREHIRKSTLALAAAKKAVMGRS
jgi:hypothetical protein